jgi:hypothetical protein
MATYTVEIPDELVERILVAKKVERAITHTDSDFWPRQAAASRELERLHRELSRCLIDAGPLYDLALDQMVEHQFAARDAERKVAEQS